MKHTEQTLSTAIGELRCIRPDTPAALDELRALSIALDCVDGLLRSCIEQMRTDPDATQSWADIAYALGSDSANAVRQRFGALPPTPNEQIATFWNDHVDRFAWDFLPSEFLHTLYTSWMHAHSADSPPVTHETFTRRVKAIATASGHWFHVRSRPQALMTASEPLLTQIPQWSMPESNRALYGLRRRQVSQTST